MTELRLIELEKAADEVLRLHEAIKASNDGYGYIDCQWPPEGWPPKDGDAPALEEHFYSALENLKALRERSGITESGWRVSEEAVDTTVSSGLRS